MKKKFKKIKLAIILLLSGSMFFLLIMMILIAGGGSVQQTNNIIQILRMDHLSEEVMYEILQNAYSLHMYSERKEKTIKFDEIVAYFATLYTEDDETDIRQARIEAQNEFARQIENGKRFKIIDLLDENKLETYDLLHSVYKTIFSDFIGKYTVTVMDDAYIKVKEGEEVFYKVILKKVKIEHDFASVFEINRLRQLGYEIWFTGTSQIRDDVTYFSIEYEKVIEQEEAGFYTLKEINEKRREGYKAEFLKDGKEEREIEDYGIKNFFPLAENFNYQLNNDFGNERMYGGNRSHEGNDIMAAKKTPIIAIEDGYVENIGWNQFGGYRIGIRSLDKKRYYYYAHLYKGKPYSKDYKKGNRVKAGDIIGFIGATGYSTTEGESDNFPPHLHIQISVDYNIDGEKTTEWINPYPILKLLERYKQAELEQEGQFKYFMVDYK